MTDFNSNTVTEVTLNDDHSTAVQKSNEQPSAPLSKMKQARAEKKIAKLAKQKKEAEIKEQTEVVLGLAEMLHIESKDIEDKAEKSSQSYNEKRYELVKLGFEIVEQINASENKEALKASLRDAIKQKYGVKTQENSTLTSIVMRCITRKDRKTAFIYGRAIEAAQAEGIDSQGVVAFIKSNNGLANIKVDATETQVNKEKERTGKHHFNMAVSRFTRRHMHKLNENKQFLGSFPMLVKTANICQPVKGGSTFVYFIGQVSHDTVNIIDVIPGISRDEENTMLTYYGLHQHELDKSKYGEDRAQISLASSITRLFDKFNAYAELRGHANRFDKYGNATDSKYADFEFSKPDDKDLDEAYEKQQAATADAAKSKDTTSLETTK